MRLSQHALHQDEVRRRLDLLQARQFYGQVGNVDSDAAGGARRDPILRCHGVHPGQGVAGEGDADGGIGAGGDAVLDDALAVKEEGRVHRVAIVVAEDRW